MDETDTPQSPAELLLILAALADAQVPLSTIAPKFTGRFNKGVDYVGDPPIFARELEQDMAVVRHAIAAFGLPAELKLSLHSGSDKFSIYGAVHDAMMKMNTGLHLKTAGTTWLEEMIGLAQSGGDALALVKEIYADASRASRGVVRAVRRGDRYRCGIAACSRRTPSDGLQSSGWSALRHDLDSPAVQQQPAPADACRVQDRCEDGVRDTPRCWSEHEWTWWRRT